MKTWCSLLQSAFPRDELPGPSPPEAPPTLLGFRKDLVWGPEQATSTLSTSSEGREGTGRGLETGDEVASVTEVTSPGAGVGLLGQEGEGLRGSGPRPARTESNPSSLPSRCLILGGIQGEVTFPQSAGLDGLDTSLVHWVPSGLGPQSSDRRHLPISWHLCFLALTHFPAQARCKGR